MGGLPLSNVRIENQRGRGERQIFCPNWESNSGLQVQSLVHYPLGYRLTFLESFELRPCALYPAECFPTTFRLRKYSPLHCPDQKCGYYSLDHYHCGRERCYHATDKQHVAHLHAANFHAYVTIPESKYLPVSSICLTVVHVFVHIFGSRADKGLPTFQVNVKKNHI